MLTAAQLNAEIDARAARLAPQLQELEALRRQLRESASLEWIAANRVTLDQVQRSKGDGVPWFGHVSRFCDWLTATGCQKRWAEWNGWLYWTAELMVGRFEPTPGMMEHVKC